MKVNFRELAAWNGHRGLRVVLMRINELCEAVDEGARAKMMNLVLKKAHVWSSHSLDSGTD